jgi:DNA-binding transcriptional regulator YhcF (GntR family)
VKVNRHSRTPPYQQVAADLRVRMTPSGDLPPGTRLPPYATLADQYGVGLGTVTRAMDQLRTSGLVETGTGGPSYVREPVHRTTVELPSRARLFPRMPTPAEQEAHGIDPGVPVAEVRHDDGSVVIYAGDRFVLVTQ